MNFTLTNGDRVHLIGDPHLGKKFEREQGVLPHRLGERELGQSMKFVDELETDAEFVVMVGDLFDKPEVSKAVCVAAARAMLGAAERNGHVTYVALAGNHDKPRNLSTIGAWHIFREMAQDRLPNLIILDRPAAFGGLAFFPWEWDRRAEDQVADLSNAVGVEHAIGHWDLSVFEGKDDHLAPVEAIRKVFGDSVGLWSGHYHRAGDYEIAGRLVHCTGSMQAYAHGEGDQYITLTREEAVERDDLHDKHVRLLLKPGETEPDLDCLAITHKRVRSETEEGTQEPILSTDDFDFSRIVKQRIKDRDPIVRGFIEERMSLNVQSAPEQR